MPADCERMPARPLPSRPSRRSSPASGVRRPQGSTCGDLSEAANRCSCRRSAAAAELNAADADGSGVPDYPWRHATALSRADAIHPPRNARAAGNAS